LAHRVGRLRERLDEEAAKYTSSLEFDKEILEAVVYVNAAHIKALAKAGILNKEDEKKTIAALKELLETPIDYTRYELEDIHMVVEDFLSAKAPKAAAMLSLGKSRNDAVVAAIKLRLKQRLLNLMRLLLGFEEKLLHRALAEAYTIFPVYTHLQRAAPATFGFIMHSYAVRIKKLIPRLRNVYDLCDESPLGSAAVAGTSIGLDAYYEAGLLGFGKVCENALEATASRDFIIDALSACCSIAIVVSSFAEELVLYSSEEFKLVELPDKLASTSSIMPQKKNPVVAEIARTKSAEILGLFASCVAIASRQPSGYNLDLQQITPKLWKALDEVEASLSIMAKAAETLTINKEKAYEACKPPTGIVELANYLTMVHGIPFRKAHNIAGAISRLISQGMLDKKTLKEKLVEFNVGEDLISVDRIYELLEPASVVKSYKSPSSANPENVKKAVEKEIEEIKEISKWVNEEYEKLSSKLHSLLTTS